MHTKGPGVPSPPRATPPPGIAWRGVGFRGVESVGAGVFGGGGFSVFLRHRLGFLFPSFFVEISPCFCVSLTGVEPVSWSAARVW